MDGVSILLIMIPGIVVGYLVMDSVRKIFSENDRLLRELFEAQPVTMIAAATTVGSVIVWAVIEALNLW